MLYFKFDETILNKVLTEVIDISEKSSLSEFSEIKGFEHRLCKLNDLINEAKSLATEQFNISEVSINWDVEEQKIVNFSFTFSP